jgi:hypothetical protein
MTALLRLTNPVSCLAAVVEVGHVKHMVTCNLILLALVSGSIETASLPPVIPCNVATVDAPVVAHRHDGCRRVFANPTNSVLHYCILEHCFEGPVSFVQGIKGDSCVGVGKMLHTPTASCWLHQYICWHQAFTCLKELWSPAVVAASAQVFAMR